jgi:hypothetical protein
LNSSFSGPPKDCLHVFRQQSISLANLAHFVDSRQREQRRRGRRKKR